MASAKKSSVKSSRSRLKGKAKGISAAAETRKTSRGPLQGKPVQSAVPDEFYAAKKELLTLRLDVDVVAYFRSTGSGYQTKMNRWLRVAMLEDLSRAKAHLPEVPPFQGEMPALNDSTFFKSKKVQMSLRLDADVVGWYKAKGKGYQSTMSRYLRLAMLEMMHSEQYAKTMQ